MIYTNIVITGSIAYDEIMDFPGEFKNYFHPEKLHQINISFVVDKLEKQLGGTATNIAYNISLISNIKNQKSKISVLGSVGKDGKEFVDFFKKNKIDTEGIIINNDLFTASGKVITDISDNQIWGYYYGASESAKKIDLKKYATNNSLLVISASHKKAFLHFQKEAIKNEINYLYDPGMSLTWISDDDLKYGVMNSKYLVGNDYEIAMIINRLNVSINQLIDAGICVITTLGEEGVRYQVKNEKLEMRSFHVEKIVDPTGAGDAWRGGFVSGLLLGMKMVECLKLGNVMASFAIEKYGTVNHKPTEEEIIRRLKKISNKKSTNE